ncbi:SIR2 family protein [Methylomonas sp. 2BW1-5-20]|uniref:SIR2 family protein n=1 Tax=Methylomonas sp. 2BW1-5-20 TaxID=3376686 RepID=UPI0040532D75
MSKGISSTAAMSKMAVRTSYEDGDILNDYLAGQLQKGSLAIVLGAGASFGFGLPSWVELIDQMFTEVGKTRNSSWSLEQAAEELCIGVYSNDRMKFAEAVRRALYKGASLTFDDLRKNDLLAAVGALTMASSRGNAAKVVSFNFDDIIKVYLSYFGYDVCIGVNLPAWSRRADVHVLHPHGLLPSTLAENIPRNIIFTQADYDDITGNSSDYWHSAILDVFRSHTCLFIGLSGHDKNLTSLLKKANDTHAKQQTGELFWGVRFSLAADPLSNSWESRGVFQYQVSGFDQIPKILFSICQRAAQRQQ